MGNLPIWPFRRLCLTQGSGDGVQDSGRVRLLPNRAVYRTPKDQTVRQEPHPPILSSDTYNGVLYWFRISDPCSAHTPCILPILGDYSGCSRCR